MDYIYSRVQEISFPLSSARRKIFYEHLQLVAKALHDIEWVDSSDCAPGDENAAIDECLKLELEKTRAVVLSVLENRETREQIVGLLSESIRRMK